MNQLETHSTPLTSCVEQSLNSKLALGAAQAKLTL
jgi:hypothetical protein